MCPITKVTLTMCDGEAFALHIPCVMMNRWPEGSNIPAEIRCYLQGGFGAKTGEGQMTYYPASSIVKITVETRVSDEIRD